MSRKSITQSDICQMLCKRLPVEHVPAPVRTRLTEILDSHKQVAIACSGGVDSVALTVWMLNVFPELRPLTTLLHFNHRTRGEQSDRDEQFVSQLARQLGVRFHRGVRSADSSDESEESLRRERIRYFHDFLTTHRISDLFTAHHRDDRVESILMRLSRGSGLDGLIAPSAIREHANGIRHLSPLLNFPKDAMRGTLLAIDQPWREDNSNTDIHYYRNFIRHEILPRWEENMGSTLFENIASTIRLLAEDADALNSWTDSVVQSLAIDAPTFPLDQFTMLPAAITRRCLWAWLNHHQLSDNLSHRTVGELARARPGDSFNLNPQYRVVADEEGQLVIERTQQVEQIYSDTFIAGNDSRLFFPGGAHLSVEFRPATGEQISNTLEGRDDPDTCIRLDSDRCCRSGEVRIGFWKPGMQYTPLGLGHRKKLQDCFVDRKVPLNKRGQLPVVMNDANEILWVPGLIPSEIGRITAQTNSLLRLTYQTT